MRCTYCGEDLQSDDVYCPFCGKKVDHSKSTSVTGKTDGIAYKCDSCGAIYETKHISCPSCWSVAIIEIPAEGVEIEESAKPEESIICSRCGAKIAVSDSFCTMCGLNLLSTTEDEVDANETQENESEVIPQITNESKVTSESIVTKPSEIESESIPTQDIGIDATSTTRMCIICKAESSTDSCSLCGGPTISFTHNSVGYQYRTPPSQSEHENSSSQPQDTRISYSSPSSSTTSRRTSKNRNRQESSSSERQQSSIPTQRPPVAQKAFATIARICTICKAETTEQICPHCGGVTIDID